VTSDFLSDFLGHLWVRVAGCVPRLVVHLTSCFVLESGFVVVHMCREHVPSSLKTTNWSHGACVTDLCEDVLLISVGGIP
jgi:hypothetical protein